MVKREVIFGSGGGLVFYQLGIASMIFKKFSTEELRENFYFGGVSAGAITSLILCYSVNGYGTPEYFFNNNVQPLIVNTQNKMFGAFFSMSGQIWKCAKQVYEECPEESKVANYKLHIIVTKLPYREKITLTNFICADNLADAVMCSSLMPGLYYKPYMTCQGISMCCDGEFCKKLPFRFNDSKAIYFTYKDKNVSEDACDNDVKQIHIDKWRNYPSSYSWIWGDPEWTHELFKQGEQDALEHIDEIAEALELEII